MCRVLGFSEVKDNGTGCVGQEQGPPKRLNSGRRVAHFPKGQTDDQAEAMWHICGVGDILGLPLTLSSGFPEQTRLVWALHVFPAP